MPRKTQVTAEEFVRQLESDPEWVARRDERIRKLDELEAEYRLNEAPLVAELNQIGFSVTSAWDLVNRSSSYTAALPILLRHLDYPYLDRISEGIARALAVREARRIAWEPILTKIATQWSELGKNTRDGLIVAVSVMATPSDLPTLVELISDKALGSSRLFLVRNFMRSKKPEARATLERLRSDPDLHEEIRYRLRKTRQQAS